MATTESKAVEEKENGDADMEDVVSQLESIQKKVIIDEARVVKYIKLKNMLDEATPEDVSGESFVVDSATAAVNEQLDSMWNNRDQIVANVKQQVEEAQE